MRRNLVSWLHSNRFLSSAFFCPLLNRTVNYGHLLTEIVKCVKKEMSDFIYVNEIPSKLLK